MPKSVKKAGAYWYLEQEDGALWRLQFESPDRPGWMERAVGMEQIAAQNGFAAAPDTFFGQTGEGGRFHLQRIGFAEPIRCWLKREQSPEEYVRIGEALGRSMRRLHELPLMETPKEPWGASFQTDIDFLMYQHGLLAQKHRNEYVLIDFIQQNRHILQALPTQNVLCSVTLDRLHIVDGQLCIDDWSWVRLGDGAYDFLFLNDAEWYSHEFCQAVLRGYSGGKPARSLFRRISLYTAVYTLKRLVDVSSGNADYADVGAAKRHFQEILESFQNFSDIIPHWAVEGSDTKHH